MPVVLSTIYDEYNRNASQPEFRFGYTCVVQKATCLGLQLGEPIAVNPAFPEYSWLVSVKVDVWCRDRHVVTCRSRPSTLSCIKTNNELLLLASTRLLCA